MDWSLGNPYARYPFLRDNLAYRRVWPYYVAMVVDPILRFQWIFYALYVQDLQHSAVMSFFVALAEVLRRGMWTLFRVENEHCNNVGRFRASRDIPLPYSLSPSPRVSQEVQHPAEDHLGAASPATGADVERTAEATGSSLRLRRVRTPETTPVERAMRRAGTILGTAHAQDYERKRRPGVVGDSPSLSGATKESDDSDEDEEEDSDGHMAFDGEEEEEVMEIQKVLSRGKVRGMD